ncbi:MAG TPA: M1 family metallopeptidase, partial [Pyrinomonadaceae bacterium]
GQLQVKSKQAFNPGSRINLSITYHGRPTDGLVLARDKDGKPSAIGDNWPNRLHHWIPSLDHPSAKATVSFNVTASSDDLVVANGRLVNVKNAGMGRRTWTYTESVPIPPYCMIIAVGDFAKLPSLSPSVTPLSYYVPQSDSRHAQTGFAPAAPALDMFTKIIAPYPYEKLALIVGATRFGGMENSSAILFTPTLFNPNPNATISPRFGIPDGNVSLIAHEVAHQWFGDSVTESTWSDLWLSEGFATYYAALFIQKHEGHDAFRTYMEKAAEAYFEFEKKNSIPIHDRETVDLLKLLNANNYQKGAWVLHMLRMRLGDEVFFRGIRAFYERHKNGIASTEDLRTALEKTSGKALREFFARWIYESGHPRYELSWTWDDKRRGAQISLKQLQAGNAFTDPVELLIATETNTQSITLIPDRKEVVSLVPLERKPTRIDLDPRFTLLREVVSREF